MSFLPVYAAGITLPRNKAVWSSRDLFELQRDSKTFNIGLQLLLMKIKKATEDVWGVSISHFRYMDFVVNFGAFMTPGVSDPKFSIGMSIPIIDQWHVKMMLDTVTEMVEWEFYSAGKQQFVRFGFSPAGETTVLTMQEPKQRTRGLIF